MALVSRAAPLCLIAAVGAALAGPAVAGPPGDWTRVHNVEGSTREVGLATAFVPGEDTRLNVLWTRGPSVLNTQISLDAKTVFPPQHVFTYGNGVSGSVQLLSVPGGGLRAFFAGIYAEHPLDVGLATATSTDGISWNVQPTLASDGRTGTRSAVYAATGIGGTIAKDGTPISVWGDSRPEEAAYHLGTSDTTPDFHFGNENSATVASPNAATDNETGQVAIAWNDLDADRVLVQSIAPLGPRLNTPGGQAPDNLERVAMTGRQTSPSGTVGGNDGIYVGYLRGTNAFLSRPAVWRIGASRPFVLSSKRGARFMGVTENLFGALWAVWARRSGGDWRIYARHSNPDVTKWGATVKLKPPRGTDTIFSLEGANVLQRNLDVVALVRRSPNDLANWHQRIRPGLTLRAEVLGDCKVRFTVLDAGSKAIGIPVTFGGKTENAGNDGTVTMCAEPGRRVARAGNPDSKFYTPARIVVRVE